MSNSFEAFEKAILPAIQAGNQTEEDSTGFRHLFSQLKRHYRDEPLRRDITLTKTGDMVTLIDSTGRFIQTDLVNTLFGQLRGIARAIDEHGIKQTQTKFWS